MTQTNRIFTMLPVLIARLDRLIGLQIDAVLHHPRLQQLESAWRSLSGLIQTGTGNNKVCIRLLDIRFEEIRHDLERALDPEHSELFNKICSQEFDHAGGEPFGVLIGDYAIDHRRAEHLFVLRTFSHITASAFVPLICGASPALFDIDSFSDLTFASHHENLLQPGARRDLHLLREIDNSRFLALALPRVRLRPCWGQQPPFDGGIPYREHCAAVEDYLWGSAGFALAAALTDEFQRTGWFTQTGVLRDVYTSNLSSTSDCNASSYGDVAFAPPPLTDVVVTDNMSRVLAIHGFISLNQCWNTHSAALSNMPSLHEATCLLHMLCASRIAHHLKAMMRDKIGSHATAADCERLIDDWLRQYTSAGRSSDPATQARYPLAAARVDITEDPYVPGHYRCTLWLTLHHNTSHRESEIRLTTELMRLAA